MIKVKVIIPSAPYPTMTSGTWRRSSAIYGIFRDGVQVGMIHSNGDLWQILDNDYRPCEGRFFMKFKDAKAWAIANMDDPRTYGGIKALSDMLMVAFK